MGRNCFVHSSALSPKAYSLLLSEVKVHDMLTCGCKSYTDMDDVIESKDDRSLTREEFLDHYKSKKEEEEEEEEKDKEDKKRDGEDAGNKTEGDGEGEGGGSKNDAIYGVDLDEMMTAFGVDEKTEQTLVERPHRIKSMLSRRGRSTRRPNANAAAGGSTDKNASSGMPNSSGSDAGGGVDADVTADKAAAAAAAGTKGAVNNDNSSVVLPGTVVYGTHLSSSSGDGGGTERQASDPQYDTIGSARSGGGGGSGGGGPDDEQPQYRPIYGSIAALSSDTVDMVGDADHHSGAAIYSEVNKAKSAEQVALGNAACLMGAAGIPLLAADDVEMLRPGSGKWRPASCFFDAANRRVTIKGATKEKHVVTCIDPDGNIYTGKGWTKGKFKGTLPIRADTVVAVINPQSENGVRATFPGIVPNGDSPDNGLAFKIVNGAGTSAEHHFMFAARTPAMLAAWLRTVRTFANAAADDEATATAAADAAEAEAEKAEKDGSSTAAKGRGNTAKYKRKSVLPGRRLKQERSPYCDKKTMALALLGKASWGTRLKTVGYYMTVQTTKGRTAVIKVLDPLGLRGVNTIILDKNGDRVCFVDMCVHVLLFFYFFPPEIVFRNERGCCCLERRERIQVAEAQQPSMFLQR